MKCRFLKWLFSIYATDRGKMQRLRGWVKMVSFEVQSSSVWTLSCILFLRRSSSVPVSSWPPPPHLAPAEACDLPHTCHLAELGSQNQMMVILHFPWLLIKYMTQIIKPNPLTYKMSLSFKAPAHERHHCVCSSGFFGALWWTPSKTMVRTKRTSQRIKWGHGILGYTCKVPECPSLSTTSICFSNIKEQLSPWPT